MKNIMYKLKLLTETLEKSFEKDFAKCKDIEAIKAELGILKEICKDLSSATNLVLSV